MFEQSPRPLDGSPLGLDTAAAVRDRPAALPFVLDNFVIVQGCVTTDGEHVAHRRSRGSGRERLAGEAPEADPSRGADGESTCGRGYSPMTWMLISRRRGPSSSAKMTDWKRPRVSSPLFTPTAMDRPSSAALRCE